jgi:serine/threonine protein kinase
MNHTEKVSDEFNNFIKRKCVNDKSVSCQIDGNKLNEITSFIAHEIPKCKKIDITLNDLKDGKVLAKGGFGYSYITAMNNDSRKKIIKVAICTDSKATEELKSELRLHSDLVNSKFDVFIKLNGYFVRNQQDVYEYYDYSNKYNKVVCNTKPQTNGVFTNGCEIYMILEAGFGDLTKYMQDKIVEHNGLSNALNAKKKYTVDTLLNVIKSYQVSEYFLEKYGKLFIHNDIKIENIVYISDTKFKFIDFGLSDKIDKFFVFDNIKGTDFTYDMLYDVPEYRTDLQKYDSFGRIKSPLYDMFCTCIAIFEFICYRTLDLVDGNTNLYQKLWKVKQVIEQNNFSYDMRNLINNLISLTTLIYDFHQNNLKVLIKTKDINKYKEINDMRNFIVPSIYNNEPPVYKVKTNNKLYNDYYYFNKIVKYYLNLSKC